MKLVSSATAHKIARARRESERRAAGIQPMPREKRDKLIWIVGCSVSGVLFSVFLVTGHAAALMFGCLAAGVMFALLEERKWR